MTTLLICPGQRNEVVGLSQPQSLALVPMLGQNLLEYWLSHLAIQGVKKVNVLAHAQPEAISALVGQGERWGLNAQVITESRELTPAEASLKYPFELASSAAAASIISLDHFPGKTDEPLFAGYQS